MGQDGEVPNIAPHLINQDMRLPSSFRTLCAQISYTNEEIGRIVRCLALGTNVFATPRIEPDIAMFSRLLKKRESVRLSVQRHRDRKAAIIADPYVEQDALMEKAPFQRRGRKSKVAVASPPGGTPVVEQAKPVAPEASKAQDTAVMPEPQEAEPIVEVIGPETVSLSDPAPEMESTPVVAQVKIEPVPVAQPAYVEKVIAAQPLTPKTKTVKMANKIATSLLELMDEPDVPKRQKLSLAAPAAIEATQRTVDTRNDAAWITVKFAIFWKQYPRKVAKGDAVKAFTKLIKKQVDVEAFMRTTLASLEWWKQQPGWTKDNGKFIPYPASWLNGGHWEDSVDNQDVICQSGQMGQAEFLKGDAESDDDLLRRMQGG